MIAPGARVLVTGASGFIGARLVEHLASEGASVRVLVREIVRAAPLTRFPIDIAVGDLLAPESVAVAVADRDVVFHCARGGGGDRRLRRAVDVDGTRVLLEACVAAGVKRVVHVSTVVTYAVPPSGTLDEHSPVTTSRDLYAAAKRDGERIAVGFAHEGKLEVAVVQPTVVYGPRAEVYGRDILEELRFSRLPLVEGGTGICNAVFVDDVVASLLLAAGAPAASGRRFLVSGPETISWKEFYAAFEGLIGGQRTVPMSRAAAVEHWRRSSRRAWLVPEALRSVREDRALRDRLLTTREGALVRRAAHRALPAALLAPERWRPVDHEPGAEALPLAALRPEVLDFMASRATVSTRLARNVLGYRPRFDFASGMELFGRWAEHVGLLDEPPLR